MPKKEYKLAKAEGSPFCFFFLIPNNYEKSQKYFLNVRIGTNFACYILAKGREKLSKKQKSTGYDNVRLFSPIFFAEVLTFMEKYGKISL